MNIEFSEIVNAYKECRKNKSKSNSTIKFEMNLEENLYNLYYDLLTDKYIPGQFNYFILTKPKYRECWASTFRDRIVHHLIYLKLKDYYFARFIYDSYACIPKKGIHASSNRLLHFIRSEGLNNKVYFLKMDIENFFISINKEILFNIFLNDIITIEYIDLLKTIIFFDPTSNYIYKGNPNLKLLVPWQKSLFNAKHNCGLPIGNLTSQFFANIYLNELDQFVKHVLKCKYYIRYVDDVIIISKDLKFLKHVSLEMQCFVKNRLQLSFHKNKNIIGLCSHGVDFVGRKLYPYHTVIRKSTLISLYKVLNNYENLEYEYVIKSINSYFGMLRKTNSFNIRKNIAVNYPKLVFDKNYNKLVDILR